MQSHLFQTKLGVGPAATRQRGGASPGMQSRGFSPTLGTRCFGAFPLFSTSRMISSQPVFAVKLEERESVTVSIRDENSAANPGRLWSNLGKDSNQHEPGSLLGAASLVAGTTVGAGVLALPSVASSAGFVPSSAVIIGCAAGSIATGLMIAEVSLSTMCDIGAGGVGLQATVERTLGRGGTAVFSIAYLFLHYALLVAYISKGGEILSSVPFLSALPQEASSLLYAASLGALCFFAPPRTMDRVNSTLVAAIILTFSALLFLALPDVQPSLLLESQHWEAVPDTIPVIALAYVYHNVVPVIATSLEGDRRKVRLAIVAGSLVPMAMFLLWDAAALGTPGALKGGVGGGVDVVAALQQSSEAAGAFVGSFSFLALTTSFIGFVFGLSDFLAGAMGMPSGRPRAVPFALTLIPPFLLSLALKDVFLEALDKAGTFGVLLLFAVLPPAMAWKERYASQEERERFAYVDKNALIGELVPGGKVALLAIGGGAGGVIVREAMQAAGLLQ